jgi:hypothetical protein
MRQLEDPLHATPQAPHETRLPAHDGFSGEHLIDERHEDGAHLLDDLFETADALGLCCFGGLATAAEDVLGFAVAFATGLE